MQRHVFHYNISQLVPYINWVYFYHAWQLKDPAEQERIKSEAMERMEKLAPCYRVHAVVAVADACSDGDDILLCSSKWRLPMLRQQIVRVNDPCLCLSDFVRPMDAHIQPSDRIGLFATSVDIGMETDFCCDSYDCMMTQLIADRLAEAAAEKMHLTVRTDTNIWGYAPDEHLTIPQLHCEEFQGIRPAIGYPSMPDASINFLIDEIIQFKEIGIRLTPSGAMKPHASVSGLIISHPKARYFAVGKIGRDQLIDYSQRRRVPVEIMQRFLAANL